MPSRAAAENCSWTKKTNLKCARADRRPEWDAVHVGFAAGGSSSARARNQKGVDRAIHEDTLAPLVDDSRRRRHRLRCTGYLQYRPGSHAPQLRDRPSWWTIGVAWHLQENHRHDDKAAQTGAVDVTVDLASADLAHDKVNEVVVGPENFNTAKYPVAHYKGTLGGFFDGVPTTVTGNLTMHGVTKPVDLKVKSFKCMPHPMYKREVCGADALGTLHRDEFGIDSGKAYGFNMEVTLRIQVEAIMAN